MNEPAIVHIGKEFKMNKKNIIVNIGGTVTGF